MPYIGVAAWTQPGDTRNPIVRAISGPERSQLAPLPGSKLEVETIASDLPRPSTISPGRGCYRKRASKHLSLNSTEVIHLALHGYSDLGLSRPFRFDLRAGLLQQTEDGTVASS